jgi:exonuclease III
MNNIPNIIGAKEKRSYSLIYNEQLLKIGTLNVKGFNALGKQLISFSIFRMEYQLDIIGLTETKTKKNENKILSKTKNTKKIDKKKQKKHL